MRVEWAVACRTLHVNDGDATVEGIAVDTLTVNQLPVELVLVVLARFACGLDEVGQEHDVAAELTAPADALESVGTLDFKINVEDPGEAHEGGCEIKIFAPLVVRFTADEEGPYGLNLYVDGRYRWQVPFRVVVVPDEDTDA